MVLVTFLLRTLNSLLCINPTFHLVFHTQIHIHSISHPFFFSYRSVGMRRSARTESFPDSLAYWLQQSGQNELSGFHITRQHQTKNDLSIPTELTDSALDMAFDWYLSISHNQHHTSKIVTQNRHNLYFSMILSLYPYTSISPHSLRQVLTFIMQ